MKRAHTTQTGAVAALFANQGQARSFRRLRLEHLEARRLLANQVLIDFTPDTIAGEYQVGRFLELFDGSMVSNANRFLNYNSDNVVDAADAQLAAKKIGNRVTTLLKDFADESDVGLQVLYTTNLTAAGDPGLGERKLAAGQDSSRNNTYVIYVGSDAPVANSTDLGFAHQAFQGENNEFYGFVLRTASRSFWPAATTRGNKSRNSGRSTSPITWRTRSLTNSDTSGVWGTCATSPRPRPICSCPINITTS